MFKKNPNLKYKLEITNNIDPFGNNDIFEVFVSFKDKKGYLISKNKKCNLDIFILLENKKIISLQEHKNYIRTVRYFLNNKDYNEYLISANDDFIVIIWDITKSYNIKLKINTHYFENIFSCLLIFPHNINDNYIITSTITNNSTIGKCGSKIYLLKNKGKFINYLKMEHLMKSII